MLTRRLHCSFCGKDETQVAKLVAGPKVYICDACVASAKQIMDDSDSSGGSMTKPTPSRWRKMLRRIARIVGHGHWRQRIGAGAL